MKHSAAVMALSSFAGCLLVNFSSAHAQFANTTIQLPVVSFHSVRTAVSVPDGGTLSLSGGSASASGSNFSSRPRSNSHTYRPPRRRAAASVGGRGGNAPRNGLRDKERAQVQWQRGPRPEFGRVNINGAADVQRKADFMTRHTTKR